MPRKEYNKLIRVGPLGPVFDLRIPTILEGQQIPFAVETMATEEYQQALRRKLVEEAQEAAEAKSTDLTFDH